MKNFIHPTAIVHESVVMGEENHIGAYCVIYPGVEIGNNNRFECHCSVGSPPEHKDHFKEIWPNKKTIIGNNNTIREFTTINAPTGHLTQMGNDCIMLRGSHLSHDSILEDKVTLSCNVLIGGHSHIMKGANIGLGACVIQRSCIGSYSMVGMGTIVTKKSKIYPGRKYVGNPARDIGVNKVGLERAGYEVEDKLHFYVPIEEDRFNQICRSKHW